ncbi:MAG TPA: right-handed parallel beta-helix repeat-containing protein [Candidatus Limnocylindria bacterium]|nr:right-handed parallel beta-helix repeat-containing protein [Candidatus Limnocylindria bacterium]
MASTVAAAAIATTALWTTSGAVAGGGFTLNVPAEYPRLEDAIAASSPGDVILLAAGTYPGDVEVPEGKGDITIRGVDRNTVIFDGEDVRRNAIDVAADGVTLENMSAHNFVENGFYWDGVEGFAGRYLTVWNVGLYAIYAISSRDGVMEHSYASGAGDAAFYIGECNPCDTVVRNVTGALSAVGYSGTNAGGNLIVEDSRFENNSVGILPNSFEVGLEPPPQRDAIFRRNVVIGTGTVAVPRATPLGGFHGIGIGILGGVGNLVEDNEVTGSTRYGIAVFTAVDYQRTWLPAENQVTGNRVSGSGTADLALAGGSGAGNCFADNEAETVLPAGLTGCSEAGDGSAEFADEIVIPPPRMLEGLPAAPPYSSMPAPPAQQAMPVESNQPGRPGRDAAMLVWIAVSGGIALALVGAVLFVLRRRTRAQP